MNSINKRRIPYPIQIIEPWFEIPGKQFLVHVHIVRMSLPISESCVDNGFLQ